ncbi:hypothetical protein CMUS01_00360 [Colletotrichum musicola]|uniref:Uncharacterized protein n=1 Tax=Colletotrichum musicola TaxID=2175873 RepID=A0A8H6NYR4_9PEZI|nr:hypothetical protein CMUS01_00360 [Colletotrichum musicola]
MAQALASIGCIRKAIRFEASTQICGATILSTREEKRVCGLPELRDSQTAVGWERNAPQARYRARARGILLPTCPAPLLVVFKSFLSLLVKAVQCKKKKRKPGFVRGWPSIQAKPSPKAPLAVVVREWPSLALGMSVLQSMCGASLPQSVLASFAISCPPITTCKVFGALASVGDLRKALIIDRNTDFQQTGDAVPAPPTAEKCSSGAQCRGLPWLFCFELFDRPRSPVVSLSDLFGDIMWIVDYVEQHMWSGPARPSRIATGIECKVKHVACESRRDHVLASGAITLLPRLWVKDEYAARQSLLSQSEGDRASLNNRGSWGHRLVGPDLTELCADHGTANGPPNEPRERTKDQMACWNESRPSGADWDPLQDDEIILEKLDNYGHGREYEL